MEEEFEAEKRVLQKRIELKTVSFSRKNSLAAKYIDFDLSIPLDIQLIDSIQFNKKFNLLEVYR